MTSTSQVSRTDAVARINIPLIVLWFASAVAVLGGYLLLLRGNAQQVELYTTQSGDYAVLFAAQSASTVGGLLIAVGALGLLLALAAHASARSRINALASTAVAVPAALEAEAAFEAAAIEAELDAEDEAPVVDTAEPVEPAKATSAKTAGTKATSTKATAAKTN